MIKIISTGEEFSAVQQRWTQLYEESHSATAFQSHAFISASLDFLGSEIRQLQIICVERKTDDSLQAVFPCYIDRRGCLRFINDRHADFCDAIVRRECYADYHIYEEVAQYILDSRAIRRVQLLNVPACSVTLSFLRYFLTSAIIWCNNAYSFIAYKKEDGQIGKGWIDRLPHLTSRERYQLKKVNNRMSRVCVGGGISLTVYSKNNGDEFPTEITTLAEAMVADRLRSEKYLSGQMFALIEALYDDGILQANVSYENGEPVAVNLLLRSGRDELIDWLVFYRKGSDNLNNLLLSLERLMETDEDFNFNFARGLYTYKIRNFRPQIHDLHGLLYSKSVIGSVRDMLAVGLCHFKQLVKRILNVKR